MPHPTDFTDAHRRHWDDAELLFGRQRWANADQLYGFSAECGLKAVMMFLGMPVDAATGTPTESHHKQHVQDIWPEFVAFVTGQSGARFLRWLPKGAPFTDWSHHNRYAHHSHFARANVDPHRAAAQSIRDMVQSLDQDSPP